jgi:quinoprotein glucose dehydrogenase
MQHPPLKSLVCALCVFVTSPDGLAQDDPAAREALPMYKIIPAAKLDELTPALPNEGGAFRNWTRSQGDHGSRRYSALSQINRANVRDLEVAWVFRSGDGAANVQCTPIVVNEVLFAPTPGRALVAVDAKTGGERWRVQFPASGTVRLQDAPARRGLVYWPGDSENAKRILVGAGDWIYALDPATGKAIEGFGEKGRVSLPTGATVSGAVWKNVFVTSGLFGDVYGFDVRSGVQLWRFHSVAQQGEFGGDSWHKQQQGANGWGGLSVDEVRGIAFVSLGAPRPDMVGVGRLGDNLFSNCVVALDALTGKRLWHFQDVRHDLWDLDVCAPPNLLTIQREGRSFDVVTGMSKAGHLMLLDRLSGKPVFPWRLRRAPVTKLPGERTADYQPDPELPEPISRMEFTPDQITDRTPEARAFVEKTVERANYGFFAPFEEGKPTLYTGSRGGAEWSGAAVDVPTGRLYVTSNRWVSKITVISNSERPRDSRQPPTRGESHYVIHCAPCHGANRGGVGTAPPLYALKSRLNDAEVLALLQTGRGLMPPNVALNAEERRDLLDFLFRRDLPAGAGSASESSEAGARQYTFDGFQFLVDHEGYPGIKPPWGLLNCYDLNTGKILWRVPLGELNKLTQQGVPVTGSQNLGGASVTAGGLVFVAGTEDEKLRAFDADTGTELWSAKLPFAGTAAPAIYEVGGVQHVVVMATGGGRVGGASGAGDAIVAFRLRIK